MWNKKSGCKFIERVWCKMTTEEMMEFYKNAWDKERENSNRLCMLKDEAIEKMIRLQKRLAIATKALKEYADRSNWYETDDFGISAVDQFACDDYGYNIAEKALKEMEGVK